jgi:hypothetical protein
MPFLPCWRGGGINAPVGDVVICHGARIVLNPQRLGLSVALRVGTTRAPGF